VRLDERECWARLKQARHGVLTTTHPERGTDAVPVVFAVVEGLIGVPVDTVKPKQRLGLARLANTARDPRCALLADHYAEDWSRLWWVRVHAQASVPGPDPESWPSPDPVWVEALAARYRQYASPGTITAVMVLRPTALAGWAARPKRARPQRENPRSSGGVRSEDE
jgi:PPOX class probable F420-dependent enzyme